MTRQRARSDVRWLKPILALFVLGSLLFAPGCGSLSETSLPGAPPSGAAVSEPVGGSLTVSFIDVGQADSILIQCDGAAMLIDAGNNADADTVVSYLKETGVTALDVVIGTHPHEDHIGSLDAVIDSFAIGQVVMPEVTTTTKTFKDVLQSIRDKDLTITTPVPGLSLNLGSADCTILAPNSSKYDDLNDWSVVVKVTYGDTSFLLMGDAGHAAEDEILARGFDVTADVLKVGHHGSSTATSEQFLNKVNPEYAVISVGAGNDYGHPSADTMNLLEKKGIPVYRTDECGTIVASSDGQTISWSVQPGSYRSGGSPK